MVYHEVPEFWTIGTECAPKSAVLPNQQMNERSQGGSVRWVRNCSES